MGEICCPSQYPRCDLVPATTPCRFDPGPSANAVASSMSPTNVESARARARLADPVRSVALPPPRSAEWSWQLQARCRGYPVALFFPEEVRGAARARQEARAKLICADCPVQARCRDHALSVPEVWGVWGATTPGERGVRRTPNTD
jgi:WhiB family transcriptional regulator, redox-sensing transcriptional regulator